MDIYPRSYKTGQREAIVKIEFQTKLHGRTGEKDINSEVSSWENFMDGSFELDVEIWVGF